jgi:hypothetical protein
MHNILASPKERRLPSMSSRRIAFTLGSLAAKIQTLTLAYGADIILSEIQLDPDVLLVRHFQAAGPHHVSKTCLEMEMHDLVAGKI